METWEGERQMHERWRASTQSSLTTCDPDQRQPIDLFQLVLEYRMTYGEKSTLRSSNRSTGGIGESAKVNRKIIHHVRKESQTGWRHFPTLQFCDNNESDIDTSKSSVRVPLLFFWHYLSLCGNTYPFHHHFIYYFICVNSIHNVSISSRLDHCGICNMGSLYWFL